MGKRHNRRRTRSRPRHRDGGKGGANHSRNPSVDTNSSYSTTFSSVPSSQFPMTTMPAHHWHQTYSAWQTRLRYEQDQAIEVRKEVEAQQLRIFGGEAGDEVSFFEPMLKVVTDLFDGFTDYEDP